MQLNSKAKNIDLRIFLFAIFLIFFVILQIKFFYFITKNNIGNTAPDSFKITLLSLKDGENYIHGLISVSDYLFALTNTQPTRLVKIKAGTFKSIETLTFPNDGKHDFGGDLIYVKAKKRIYIVFRGLDGMYLSEINPDTLTYTDISNPKTGINGGTPAISSDGNYLYVLTNTKPSVIHKISLSSYKQVTSSILIGFNNGHAIQFDGTYLYATGIASPAWIAKIDPRTLKFTSQYFLTGENYATDDLAVTKDYAFVGLEAKNGIILRIRKDSLSHIDRINTGIGAECYGVFFYNGSIWALFNTIPGKLVNIDPQSLKMKEYLFNIGEDSPSEMASVNQELFIAFWMSPGKIVKIKTSE